MTDAVLPRLNVSEGRLNLTWPDGKVTTAPAAWLFDNAAGAFDPGSGHRLTGALELASAQGVVDARLDGDAVRLRFAPGGEERRVLLTALSPDVRREAGPELWLTPEAVAEAPPVAFDAYLTDDAALAEALGRIVRYGMVFLSGAGTNPQTVEHAVARFGHIRETNYGRLFDVREEPTAGHLAYTAVGLDLHTDNPYRDPTPTLQALHFIEAAGEGGESQFVDGFAHAAALRAAAPARFEVLAATAVEFAYRGPAGERYSARAPVIETAPGESEVKAVRVNHRSLAPLPLASGVVEAWYEAYLDFYRRMNTPAARLERKLAPGDMVVFDNRRVLHGRSAYNGGRRWLQGCYAERDGLLATLSRLRQSVGNLS